MALRTSLSSQLSFKDLLSLLWTKEFCACSVEALEFTLRHVETSQQSSLGTETERLFPMDLSPQIVETSLSSR